MIKVVIIDDHPIIRMGLSKVLQKAQIFELQGAYSNPLEFLEDGKISTPDIIITDLDMPKLDGISFIPEVKKKYPKAKIVVFTMHEGEGFFKEAIYSGVDGYIIKSEELTKIPKILEQIQKGEFYATSPFTKNFKSPAFKYKLSEKEHKILNMLLSGLTAKEIGERINLSKRTVEYYSKKLKEKFEAENVIELVSRVKDKYYR